MALSAAPHPRDLTDEQWDLIGPFLSELLRRKDGRGRLWRENRAVLNGILWILRTGAPWADLPDRYPSYQTCHRRFQQSVRLGVLRSILFSLRHSPTSAIWICRKRSSMGASRRPSGVGPAWARQSATRGQRSWPSPIVTGVLSPFTSRAPRRMKSSWYTC
jgi:transposase